MGREREREGGRQRGREGERGRVGEREWEGRREGERGREREREGGKGIHVHRNLMVWLILMPLHVFYRYLITIL